MKPLLALITIIIFFPGNAAFAYFSNYPPYKFKESPPKHIEAKLLVDSDKPKFKSKDGKIFVKLEETASGFNFLLKDGKLTLARLTEEKVPLPNSVYLADLDSNGMKDFIVFYNYRGSGLASQKDKIEIYLKNKGGSYQRISFDTLSAGLEDFVDLDRDGKWEVIITGFYRGAKHNYFTYDIYRLKNYRLVNADNKYGAFPKFIWITYNKNDKNTVHLTEEEKLEHVKRKDDSIHYEEVRLEQKKTAN